MRYWNFKRYRPKDGFSQIEAWYDVQDDGVRAEFDFALFALAEIYDWSDETDCIALGGDFLGLFELIIEAETDLGEFVQIRPIGFHVPDSCDFIILLCCEKHGTTYDPPLTKAVEYKQALQERGEGELEDYGDFSL